MYICCVMCVCLYEVYVSATGVCMYCIVLQMCGVACTTLPVPPSPPCSGDLRLVEKPTPTVLGPHGFENIKATIKISSTENGIIFGNIGK